MASPDAITRIWAREVLNFRGHPTVEGAKKIGVDIAGELKRHNTTPALWRLNSGILATPNISLVDLTVAVIMGRGA